MRLFTYNAGILPFNREKGLSQLRTNYNHEPTPLPSRPSTSSSANWSPKTPYNTCTLEQKAKYIKGLLNWTNLNKESPSSQAFNQLIKGSLVIMHNTAILAGENDQLRETVDQLQKRHSRRTRALPNKGILSVSKGQELAQEFNKASNPPPATNQNKASKRRQRSAPRYSNC